MTSSNPSAEYELPLSEGQSPLHGYQGNRGSQTPAPVMPKGLTIAISREAGSRGSSIARRVGRLLGWQVYTQELLEYIAQEGVFRQRVADSMSGPAAQWAEERLHVLLREQKLTQHPAILDLAQVVLALGAEGDVVLVGRGAGSILPPASTLHVRIVAPLADRVAYMSQWLRLTTAEAAEEVRVRDQRRADFLSTHFHRQPSDIYQYDLLLNSSLLGEERCADLIVHAARTKKAALTPDETA